MLVFNLNGCVLSEIYCLSLRKLKFELIWLILWLLYLEVMSLKKLLHVWRCLIKKSVIRYQLLAKLMSWIYHFIIFVLVLFCKEPLKYHQLTIFFVLICGWTSILFLYRSFSSFLWERRYRIGGAHRSWTDWSTISLIACLGLGHSFGRRTRGMRLAAAHHARWCPNVLLEKLIWRLYLLLLVGPVIPILPLLILQFILLYLNTLLHNVLHRAPVVICLLRIYCQICAKNANSVSSSRTTCNSRIYVGSV